jgi:hypothetical protein
VILGIALLIELLPIVAGTGEDARFDWGWLYVTAHFIVLPLVCAVHIVVNLYRLKVLFHAQRPRALRAALSLAIPVGYLVLLYLSPVFPLWSALTFKELSQGVGANG